MCYARCTVRSISKKHFSQLNVGAGTTYSSTLEAFLGGRSQWHRHCFHCMTTSDESKEVAKRTNRMPTTAWAGFPPGLPKPGHFRLDRNRSSSVQPNAQTARATFSAWGRRARAFFHFVRVITRIEATRIINRWSQKDAPMVWVDSPPLIRPGRGVQRGLRV